MPWHFVWSGEAEAGSHGFQPLDLPGHMPRGFLENPTADVQDDPEI